MTKTATPQKPPETKQNGLEPPSREQLERLRQGVLAVSPTGATYRLRQLNLERHALSGGLPQKLRRIAMQGSEGLDQLFAGDDGQMSDEGLETRAWLDRLVLATVVEPALTVEDLGSGDVGEDPLVPARDYKWLLAVAMGDENHDGQGRRLWGLEPLDRFAWFRAFHGCDEGCESCSGLRAAVSSSLSGPLGAVPSE